MQPPRPTNPEPRTTSEGHATPGTPTPGRHPQSPPDLYFAQGPASEAHLVGTRDPDLVVAWAAHHGAEPATGQETASGPATVHVNDQGTGLRFNFPGAARFRPLAWDEWLALFDRDELVFVYEAGHDDGAPRPLFGGAYYRLVPGEQWGQHPLATLAP